MTRQINLLPAPPKRPLFSARNATLVLLVWCAVLAIQVWLGERAVDAAKIAADRSARNLQERQQLQLALQKKLGSGGQAGDIATQIAALEPRTRVSRDLLARLKSGELGSLEGYSAQLTEFARIPAEGVWVTTVTVADAGRALRVDGRALRKEQVLPYAALLNRAMHKYGIVVKDVEITPLKQPASEDSDSTAVPVWAFRLY